MAPQSAFTKPQLIVIELFDGILVGAHVFRDLGLPVQRVYFSTCDGLVELVNHTNFPDAENIGIIEQINVELIKDIVKKDMDKVFVLFGSVPTSSSSCLLYTSPSPRDRG